MAKTTTTEEPMVDPFVETTTEPTPETQETPGDIPGGSTLYYLPQPNDAPVQSWNDIVHKLPNLTTIRKISIKTPDQEPTMAQYAGAVAKIWESTEATGAPAINNIVTTGSAMEVATTAAVEELEVASEELAATTMIEPLKSIPPSPHPTSPPGAPLPPPLGPLPPPPTTTTTTHRPTTTTTTTHKPTTTTTTTTHKPTTTTTTHPPAHKTTTTTTHAPAHKTTTTTTHAPAHKTTTTTTTHKPKTHKSEDTSESSAILDSVGEISEAVDHISEAAKEISESTEHLTEVLEENQTPEKVAST